MFYLIYIDIDGHPGRCYGPADYHICFKKMQEFIKEDDNIIIPNDYDSSSWHKNEETVSGWHIIQIETF